MNRILFSRITWTLALAVALQVSVGIVSYVNTTALIDAGSARAQSRQLLLEVENVLSAVKDAETGQRGFLLTGKEEYLEPYHSARKDIDERLQRLDRQSRDNPEQQRQLQALRPLVALKLAELKNTIGVRRTEGLESALRIVLTDVGQRHMNQMRDVAGEMENDAIEAIGRLDQETSARGETAFFWSILGSTLAAILVVLGGFFLLLQLRGRRQAETALASANRRFQAILDGATEVAIIATDPQGAITAFNTGAEKMLGYSAQEMLGKTPERFHLPAEVRNRAGQLSEECGRPIQGFETFVTRARRGEVEEREWTYVCKSGTELAVNLAVTALRDAEGKLTGFLGVAKDMTAFKAAGMARQKALDAAESANRAKSEFLANMSHEIRTPLNGIIGMTELVLDTDLDPEQRDFLETVRDSAEALLVVINDILDFSKIEAGKLDLDSCPFDLRDSLTDMVKPLALRAQQKGLELACDVQADVPDARLGDVNRLRQIITNLVGNAIKFTERGEVVVRVEVFRVWCLVFGNETLNTKHETPNTAALHFSVRDTGIGIPADKRSAIFDPFTQADGSMTRKYGGTGLGLAISARLVRMMGGQIWVESEVGQGSTFHFTMPLEVRPGIPARQLPRQPARLEGLRVLVVDDNATNRRILEETLHGWRMRPTTVADGWAALAELDREPYGLILLDAQMPHMDGLTLAEKIRGRSEQAGIPVLMLSSAGWDRSRPHPRTLGIAAQLTKPVKQSDLLIAIETVLGATTANVAEPEPEAPRAPKQVPVLAPDRPLRVLVVEDHPLNQLLTLRLLEKKGHQTRLAANGEEALAVLEQETFDLILMDVQMPQMNGFDATARIREREQGTGRHVPIIAMTAHAMTGDRERCLSAGMDGYLSKPVCPAEMFGVMADLVGHVPNGARARPAAVLDPDAVLEKMNGDRDFLREMAGLFEIKSITLLDDVRHALAEGNVSRLQGATHDLKNWAASFAAPVPFEAAQRLEEICRTSTLHGAPDACTALEDATGRLREELSGFVARMNDSEAAAPTALVDVLERN